MTVKMFCAKHCDQTKKITSEKIVYVHIHIVSRLEKRANAGTQHNFRDYFSLEFLFITVL